MNYVFEKGFFFVLLQQLSQFWYSENTIQDISLMVEKTTRAEDQVALLSCPSLYIACKEKHHNTKIFEYDERFNVWGEDFVQYDFNNASNDNYLNEFSQYFDLIIADPPFLSEECVEKVSFIIKKLLKPNGKILFCTGEMVENYIVKFLGLKKCNYKPTHTRNLGNEFTTYANFNSDTFFE